MEEIYPTHVIITLLIGSSKIPLYLRHKKLVDFTRDINKQIASEMRHISQKTITEINRLDFKEIR